MKFIKIASTVLLACNVFGVGEFCFHRLSSGVLYVCAVAVGCLIQHVHVPCAGHFSSNINLSPLTFTYFHCTTFYFYILMLHPNATLLLFSIKLLHTKLPAISSSRTLPMSTKPTSLRTLRQRWNSSAVTMSILVIAPCPLTPKGAKKWWLIFTCVWQNIPAVTSYKAGIGG